VSAHADISRVRQDGQHCVRLRGHQYPLRVRLRGHQSRPPTRTFYRYLLTKGTLVRKKGKEGDDLKGGGGYLAGGMPNNWNLKGVRE